MKNARAASASRPGRWARGFYYYRNQWSDREIKRVMRPFWWHLFDEDHRRMVYRALDELEDAGDPDPLNTLAWRIRNYDSLVRGLTYRTDGISGLREFLQQYWHLQTPEMLTAHMRAPHKNLTAWRPDVEPNAPRTERIVKYLSDMAHWRRVGGDEEVPDRPNPDDYGLTKQDVGEA